MVRVFGFRWLSYYPVVVIADSTVLTDRAFLEVRRFEGDLGEARVAFSSADFLVDSSVESLVDFLVLNRYSRVYVG